ncbi:hypothetical protein ACFLQN_04090 [Candidatus Aenigmatarchaeota archaeon]
MTEEKKRELAYCIPRTSMAFQPFIDPVTKETRYRCTLGGEYKLRGEFMVPVTTMQEARAKREQKAEDYREAA